MDITERLIETRPRLYNLLFLILFLWISISIFWLLLDPDSWNKLSYGSLILSFIFSFAVGGFLFQYSHSSRRFLFDWLFYKVEKKVQITDDFLKVDGTKISWEDIEWYKITSVNYSLKAMGIPKAIALHGNVYDDEARDAWGTIKQGISEQMVSSGISDRNFYSRPKWKRIAYLLLLSDLFLIVIHFSSLTFKENHLWIILLILWGAFSFSFAIVVLIMGNNKPQ